MAVEGLGSICRDLVEGVYRFDASRGWVVAEDEPQLASGRPAILVFVNVYCRPACMEVMGAVERVLGRYVAEGAIEVWLVVCTKFRRLCWDERAKRLFAMYRVYGAPTAVVVDGNGVVLGSLKGPLMVSRNLPRVLEELQDRLARRS